MIRFVHTEWAYFVGVSQKWTTAALQPHSGLVLGDSASRLPTKASRGPLWVGGKSRMESNHCWLQGCSLSYFLSLLSVQLGSWKRRWGLAMQGCFPRYPLRTAGPFPNCGSSARTQPSAASLGLALGQGFSDLHCWHLRQSFFAVGAIACIAVCLALSLASTYWNPTLQSWQSKVSPDIAKFSLGESHHG